MTNHRTKIMNPALLKMHEFKLWIFDADGTLRRCKEENQPCPNKQEDQYIPDHVRSFFKTHNIPKWGIASNQKGVSLGYLSEADAMNMLKITAKSLGGLPDEAVRMCPDDDPLRRKPGPGMLQEIMQYYAVSPAHTIYVGDMDSDRQAAANAGCAYISESELFHQQIGIMGRLLNIVFLRRDRRQDELSKTNQLVKSLIRWSTEMKRAQQTQPEIIALTIAEKLINLGATQEAAEDAATYWTREIWLGLLGGNVPSNKTERWLIPAIAGNMTYYQETA